MTHLSRFVDGIIRVSTGIYHWLSTIVLQQVNPGSF